MKPVLRNTLLIVLGVALLLGVAWRMGAAESARPADPSGTAKFTVVSTDGAHIIVVDNATAKLYYYAIDRDGKIGDELKLRGTLDLNDVGKAILKPVSTK
jgi:hypothetical protein